MEKNKIESYLGFCIRSRKILFGAEMIERQKKGVYLLICDGAIGKNSLKSVVKAKQTLSCPLYQTEEGALGEWTRRPSVKAVAILDEHLAAAILSVAEGQMQEIV